MDILFMGSAGFAVPSLGALADSHHDILEVVTQPDKPAGRGMRLRACPAAQHARERGLAVYQPPSVRKPDAIEHFRELSPELIVVIAYGKILPKDLLELPTRGCINVHASLLPKYRGAAPINWAIAYGETETGVTTMFINEDLDAGDMLLAAKTPIGPEETAQDLHDRLARMGADLLMATIRELEEGALRPRPQDHSKATLAPLIKKEDGHIDWSMSAIAIHNRMRAFTPWPGSFTTLRGKALRVHAAEPRQLAHDQEPGTVLDREDHLCIACGDGVLDLKEVQMEGGRRMKVADFLRGHKVPAGEALV